MSASALRTMIRSQAEAVINDWAANCTVSRATITTDDSGRKVRSYASVATAEKIWIQPLSGEESVQPEGVEAQTTHRAFQQRDGYALEPNDRILPSGGTYAFDVVAAHVYESHRQAQVKQVARI